MGKSLTLLMSPRGKPASVFVHHATNHWLREKALYESIISLT
jgi:hypothetical protein